VRAKPSGGIGSTLRTPFAGFQGSTSAKERNSMRQADDCHDAATAATTIRGFIEEEFLLSSGPTLLADDDLLFEGGIIDSVGAVTLVCYLEETFGIRINDDELFPENFATVGHITRFIQRKKSLPSAVGDGGWVAP
jgi:acyl carrier protein